MEFLILKVLVLLLVLLTMETFLRLGLQSLLFVDDKRFCISWRVELVMT